MINSDTLQILLRTGLQAGGGWLISKGLASDATAKELEGAVALMATFIWALIHHSQAKAGTPQAVPVKQTSGTGTGPMVLLLLALLIALAGLLCGCSSAAIKAGDIVSIKERTFGITVSESPASGTPQIRLGFNSMVVQFIPTSTNGPIAAPRYADTFDLHQGINPFGTGISENTGAGDVMTGTNGLTRAIVPTAEATPATAPLKPE